MKFKKIDPGNFTAITVLSAGINVGTRIIREVSGTTTSFMVVMVLKVTNPIVFLLVRFSASG